MRKIVKLQIRNVFHNPLFYVCLAFISILSIIVTRISNSLFNTESLQVLPQIESFLSSEVGIIGIIFIALYCCYDFNEGTTKNIIGRGYTKTQYLFSKYIGSLIGLFVIYIINIILILILYSKNGTGYEHILSLQIINSVISIIAYTILYSTISVLLEKNGAAIIACLFVPQIISILFGLIDSKLHIHVAKYWIDNVSNKFLSTPNVNNLLYSILLYIVYIAIFTIIGSTLFKRKEIK